ncbi:hypothetical protein [Caballeronia catudaia]|uniref:hypothetical protein n=1 Tax=Caballeronia catudaia TaxID=1777136 RepID=UPI00117C99C3|nr:hypothetical protein [Caballeronia catudaia]
MDHASIHTFAAALPCDYIFSIDYYSAGSAAHIIKDAVSVIDAWRRLTASHDLCGVRSIAVEAQPREIAALFSTASLDEVTLEKGDSDCCATGCSKQA